MAANNSCTFVTTFFRDGRKGKFTKLVLTMTNLATRFQVARFLWIKLSLKYLYQQESYFVSEVVTFENSAVW